MTQNDNSSPDPSLVNANSPPQEQVAAMNELENRQRAVPLAVLQGRAARAVVRPYSNRLGEWQSESIKLQAMADREPDADGKIEAATRALMQTLTLAETEFETTVASLADTVRMHSSINDARRGFDMIRTRLDQTLTRFR